MVASPPGNTLPTSKANIPRSAIIRARNQHHLSPHLHHPRLNTQKHPPEIGQVDHGIPQLEVSQWGYAVKATWAISGGCYNTEGGDGL